MVRMEGEPTSFNIGAVERETGLTKDVLRVWERRYAFPKPARDENGERRYAASDVAKLRTIKRLMDVGVRPGRIVGSTQADLDALAAARIGPPAADLAPALERDAIALVRGHDAVALQQAFASLLMKQGLQRFVAETVVPLNRAIGDAWMRGALAVFEEHFYTEQLQAALRTAINAFPRPTGSPRVLLTTFPGEQHGLGLLMVEALLVAEAAQCVSLGVQTPLEEIRLAALAHRAQVVALSFSGAYPVRQAGDGIATLRRQLPASIALWAGGEATRRVRKALPGVALMPDLAGVVGALKAWRAQAAAQAGTPA